MLKIYGSDLSAPANKVRFVANALEIQYEYVKVNLREGEHRTKEFLEMHPAGKIPVIDDEGFVLFESNAIVKYLADKTETPLYPKDLKNRAIIDQWIDFSTIHVGGAMGRVLFNRVFAKFAGVPVDERSLEDGLKFLNRFLPIINQQLGRTEFICGGIMTLADIVLLATIDPIDIAQVDISSYENIVHWRRKMMDKEFYTKCYKEYGESLKQPS